MLNRAPARRRGERGQALIGMILVFLALFTALSLSIARSGDVTQEQHRAAEAAATAHGLAEGGALFGIANAARADAPACSAAEVGHLTFPSEVLNYASQSCATVNASTSGGDCALCVMSAGASALYVQDNKAKVSVVGAIDVKGGISNNGTICAKASQADPGCGGPAPKSSVAALTDPLASSYPAPTVKTLGTVSVIGGVKTATPGVYTASNLALLNSAATLQPGAYVIAGGSYQPPDVSGSGVMIYLTCSGYLTGGCRQGSNGWATLTIFNTSVNLSAPTGGVYSGLVIFADRNNNSSPTLSFQNSGGTSTISGTMYAVAGSISLQANNATLSGGGRIVVGTANVQGSNNSVGLDLTSPSVDTPCSAYDESVTGVPSTGTTGFGRVAFQTACSGGSAIVDFNYGP